jgi:hypothetical protein
MANPLPNRGEGVLLYFLFVGKGKVFSTKSLDLKTNIYNTIINPVVKER